ncbi:MAG: 3-hydroxybutyrate dehydrogenase [Alphaproteobacteria bacterium]|nr:MAG: 3-hydroxybutyrate dehydrogenase [Alphaproteobacteria bacterium]
MLQNKKVLITGSTSGIGLSIAEKFAGQGCNIMIHGLRDQKQLQNIQNNLMDRFKVEVRVSDADVANSQDLSTLADEAAKWGVDILINNAGIQHVSPIENFAPEKWDQVMAVNLRAAYFLIHKLIAGMKKSGWGRIVNIASAHGLVASINKAAYVASKHGLVGLTKVVALESANDGITCNAICPGWVHTDIVEKQIQARASASGRSAQETALDLIAEKMPYHKFVQPDEVASLALYLASDAARAITGASLSIDGAWTAQ